MNRKPPSIQHEVINENKVGEPLILTPLIEQGLIKQALEESAITQTPFIGPNNNIKSFSGYFTVDKFYNSNLFFWFFLSENDPESDPVILWLQGGPGASSLYALFTENGPYIVDKDLNLSYREYSWTKNHSVIYIDNPAGTGFSYTTEGYARNETKVGKDLYAALIQFFELFPQLRKNDFFITGESYGGHYIPAIAHRIFQKNPEAVQKINLQGFAIGNSLTDAKYQSDYGSYLFNLGLIDSNVADSANSLHLQLLSAIDGKDYKLASQLLDDIRDVVHDASGIPNVYNHQELLPEDQDYFVDYLSQESIRPQIHVGNLSYGVTDRKVQEYLTEDRTQSVSYWLEELINHYRVLLFNGQLDTVDPYPLMINLIRNLHFNHKNEYLRAQREIWYVGNEIAGYSKTGGNFTEVLVRDAGHMVPTYKPKWALYLIFKFVRNIKLTE